MNSMAKAYEVSCERGGGGVDRWGGSQGDGVDKDFTAFNLFRAWAGPTQFRSLVDCFCAWNISSHQLYNFSFTRVSTCQQENKFSYKGKENQYIEV